MPDLSIRVLLEPVEEISALREQVVQLSSSLDELRNKYKVLEHKYCLSLEETMVLRDRMKQKHE